MVDLSRSLAGFADLPVARAFLDDRLTTLGPERFAAELDPLLAGAAAGAPRDRRAMLVVGSHVAHVCARGEAPRLLEIGAAAARAGLPLSHALFEGAPPRASLAPGARLAEVGTAVFACVSGIPGRRFPDQSEEEWRTLCAWLRGSPGAQARMVQQRSQRWREHHDPIFIGRVLDQGWMTLGDVVFIAARRPTVPAIVFAVATRDRWYRNMAVRSALAQNPYTPPLLARALAMAG